MATQDITTLSNAEQQLQVAHDTLNTSLGYFYKIAHLARGAESLLSRQDDYEQNDDLISACELLSMLIKVSEEAVGKGKVIKLANTA